MVGYAAIIRLPDNDYRLALMIPPSLSKLFDLQLRDRPLCPQHTLRNLSSTVSLTGNSNHDANLNQLNTTWICTPNRSDLASRDAGTRGAGGATAPLAL